MQACKDSSGMRKKTPETSEKVLQVNSGVESRGERGSLPSRKLKGPRNICNRFDIWRLETTKTQIELQHIDGKKDGNILHQWCKEFPKIRTSNHNYIRAELRAKGNSNLEQQFYRKHCQSWRKIKTRRTFEYDKMCHGKCGGYFKMHWMS